jgi:DNA-binding GntR family transcriptional regulator
MAVGPRRASAGARSLSTRIYHELKRDILRCALRPGQDVFEGQLAERYGVSKTPIREALNTLRQEGYVHVMPRRGYRIAPVSVQDVQHIFHVRLLLEPSAAELAAQRVSGEQLVELRRLAQHRSNQSRSERMAANRSFHLAVAEASGNPRLTAFIGRLLEDVERLYHLGIDLNAADVARTDHHEALVDALIKGDHHQARDIMAEAVQASRKRIMEALIGSETAARALYVVNGERG